MRSPRPNADLNEILFERRNKAYGAYTLRTQGDTWMMRATLIGLALFVVVTAVPAFLAWVNPPKARMTKETAVEDWSWVSMILPPDKPAQPEPVAAKAGPRQTAQPTQNTTRFVTPQPSPLAPQAVTIIEVDSILHNPGLVTMLGTGGLWSDLPEDSIVMRPMRPTPMSNPRPDPRAFVPGVEREPQELNLEDLRKEIGYPEMAKEGHIQGNVTLRVLMDENGNYREHLNVSRTTPHPLLIQAVERHIQKLRCQPGIQNGVAIPMWVNVNFSFKLK